MHSLRGMQTGKAAPIMVQEGPGQTAQERRALVTEHRNWRERNGMDVRSCEHARQGKSHDKQGTGQNRMIRNTSALLPAIALIALLSGVGALLAGPRDVVVELYTSQGCSSCPPADELLGKLARREGVIPLALHVDYWDYIGWKDTFGRPEYSARQKAYARAAGRRMVYTPQMIIGGVHDVVGSKPMEVLDRIEEMQKAGERVKLAIELVGNELRISAEAPRPERMDVQLVRFLPKARVAIRAGELAGKELEYTNIVTAWEKIGKWDGRAPLRMTRKIDGDLPLVVIIQKEGPGPILAAERLR